MRVIDDREPSRALRAVMTAEANAQQERELMEARGKAFAKLVEAAAAYETLKGIALKLDAAKKVLSQALSRFEAVEQEERDVLRTYGRQVYAENFLREHKPEWMNAEADRLASELIACVSDLGEKSQRVTYLRSHLQSAAYEERGALRDQLAVAVAAEAEYVETCNAIRRRLTALAERALSEAWPMPVVE